MLWNGHGDVVQIINEAGTVVNSYTYDDWGNIRSKTEGISNPIRYAGEYFDEESGLYYLRARYYDPVVARFITKDSYEGDISNPLSINQYSYCTNNPLGFIDPSGHIQEEYLNGYVFNRYGEVIGTCEGASRTDNSQIATDTHGGSHLANTPWNAGSTNGNNNNNEAIASQQSPKSNSNPDPLKQTAKTTTGSEEINNNGSNSQQPNGVYDEGYSIDPFYGINNQNNNQFQKEKDRWNNYSNTTMYLGMGAAVVGLLVKSKENQYRAGVVSIASGLSAVGIIFYSASQGFIDKDTRNSKLAVSAPSLLFGGLSTFAKGAINIVGKILSIQYDWAASVFSR